MSSGSPAFHLAWKYVSGHRVQTALLAAALGLVLALPLCVRVAVHSLGQALEARAAATPQVVGARGSALDLMLAALYFKTPQPVPVIPVKAWQDLQQAKLGMAVPLYLRFHARKAPIVGSSLNYFTYRHLALQEGRLFGRLGDCVVGSAFARRHQVQVGGHVFSDQEQVFDLAGTYPLKMRVTGILKPAGTADDDAIFTDIKTTWLIQGLAHGHEDVKAPETVLETKEDGVVANASVRMFNEVTDTNLASFHFHGDSQAYPLSAVLLLPADERAEAILAGRYLKADQPLQLIRPLDEFHSLMGTLFRLESMALAVFAVLAVAAFSVAALVFALTFKLRKREFATLADLGVSVPGLWRVRGLEVVMVALLAATVAGGLVALAHWQAPAVVTLLQRL